MGHLHVLLAIVALRVDAGWRELKQQSTITFAFVGPYEWLSASFAHNATQIVDGFAQLNLTSLGDIGRWDAARWFFWNQFAADAAVAALNSDPRVLPNTTVKVKRFDSARAPMLAAIDVGEAHGDVVAVFGEFDGETTGYSAEVYNQYKLPLCGCSQYTLSLLDRNIYPYYIQTMTYTGFRETIALMLNFWNVKRVGLVCAGSTRFKDGGCWSVREYLLQKGFDIVVEISYASSATSNYTRDGILGANARYLILLADPDATADIYFNLALDGRVVGADYVWISLNSPMSNPINAPILYGADYFKYARGLIVIWNTNPNTEAMWSRINKFIDEINVLQEPWGVKFTYEIAFNWFNMLQAYDCIGLLAHGINKLLEDGLGLDKLMGRQLQSYMNYTLFQNTGYLGLTGDPVTLTDNGDVAASGQALYIDGLSDEFHLVQFGTTDMALTKFMYLENVEPLFYSGKSSPPLDGAILSLEVILESNWMGKIVQFFFFSGIIVVIMFLTIILKYWNLNSMIAFCPQFLCIEAVGSVPVFVASLLYLNIPTPAKCRAILWLQLSSYAIVVSAVVLKNLRVWFVYHTKQKLTKESVSIGRWTIPVAICLIVQQLLLVAWTSTSVISIPRIVTQRNQVEHFCRFKSKNSFAIYSLWTFNILLLLCLIATTFKTHQVCHKHSESSKLTLLSISLVGGIVLIQNMNESLSSNVQNSFNQAFLVWAVTILPLTMQTMARGVGVHLDMEKIQIQSVSSRLNSSVQRGGPLCIRVPIMIETYNVALRSRQSYWSRMFGEWHRGVVCLVKVREKVYIQFLPVKFHEKGRSFAFTIEKDGTSWLGSTDVAINGDKWVRVFVQSKTTRLTIDFFNVDEAKAFQTQIMCE
ncbi:periplasmic binding protein-like I [Obelidium mucronatum]|nr:periplasmic binding protein-like I [Obelidium mucronatum]